MILPPLVVDYVHVKMVANEDDAPDEVWDSNKDIVKRPVEVNKWIKDAHVYSIRGIERIF